MDLRSNLNYWREFPDEAQGQGHYSGPGSRWRLGPLGSASTVHGLCQAVRWSTWGAPTFLYLSSPHHWHTSNSRITVIQSCVQSTTQRRVLLAGKHPVPAHVCAGVMAFWERTALATCKRVNGVYCLWWFLYSLAYHSCRYANMDFIVFAGLTGIFLLALVFSYDIICQWSQNLVK